MNINTHSTYSIKYLNTHQALNELVYVIESMLKGEIKQNDNHLKVVIEEVREIVQNDWFFNKKEEHYYKLVISRLQEIPRVSQRTKLYAIVYQMNYIINEIKESYLFSIVEEIKMLLLQSKNHDVQEELEQLDYLIGILVSELIAMGWSRNKLYLLIRNNFLQSEDEVTNKWEIFFSELLRNPREFICFFQFENVPNDDITRKMKALSLDVLTGAEIIGTFNELTLNKHLKKSDVFIRVIINSYDPYSAYDTAWNKIKRNLDVLQFYGYYSPQIKKNAILINTSNNQFYRNILGSTLRLKNKYRAPEKAIGLMNDQLNNPLYENINKKLENLLDFSRQSEESKSSQNAFINLWIALESFVKGDEDFSGFETVRDNISSADAHNYLYSLIKNLMEDFKRCRVIWVTENIGSNQVKKEYEFLDYLLDENKGPDLIEKCYQVNILLGYRCEQIRDVLLCGKKTSRLLQKHKENVKRHLHRLYRIRNDIVHAGKTNYNVNLFIKHLRDYMESVVTVVLYRIQNHDVVHLDEVFSMINDNVDLTIEILKEFGINQNNRESEYKRILLNGVF